MCRRAVYRVQRTNVNANIKVFCYIQSAQKRVHIVPKTKLNNRMIKIKLVKPCLLIGREPHQCCVVLCCVVPCCVVLCLLCLCCVVPCCVVPVVLCLCCVVSVVLCCAMLCCVVSVVLCLCCVVSCLLRTEINPIHCWETKPAAPNNVDIASLLLFRIWVAGFDCQVLHSELPARNIT